MERDAVITLDEIIEKTTDLPTMPAAALKVISQSDDSNATAASISQALAADQALSVRVLRLANSAFYSLPRRVCNLQEAVIVLGMRSVRNLAMVASSYPWMVGELKGYAMGPKELWKHSLAVAIGAQQLALRAKTPGAEAAFTAGLLHDLGKVALSLWLENKIVALSTYARREQITFDQAERAILGYDHTQVGGRLAEQWNLPESIVSAIRYHHSPHECDDPAPIVDCVHVADYLAMSLGFGIGGDGVQYRLCAESLDRLSLSAESLDEAADLLVATYEEYGKLFEELRAA